MGREVTVGGGFVGGSNDLADVHAATGHNAHCSLRPMIPPTLGVHLGGATELAPGEDGDVVEHTSFLKIGNERPESVIEDGTEMPHAGKIVGMGVEVAQGYADAAYAGLHESTGDEKLADCKGTFRRAELLARDGLRRSEAFKNARIFARQVESLGHFARSKNGGGALGEGIGRGHGAGIVEPGAYLVETLENAEAHVEALGIEPVDEGERIAMVFAEAGELPLHAFFQFAFEKVGNIRTEGLVRSAEKPGTSTVASKGTPLHEIDEGGRIVGARTKRFFHNASHGGSTRRWRRAT